MEEETDWSQISRIDQRSYIKIETLRGKTPTEIHNALHEVCGDSVVDRSTVSRWASRLREGRVSIQDDPRSGRPVTASDDPSVVIVTASSYRFGTPDIGLLMQLGRESDYKPPRIHRRESLQ